MARSTRGVIGPANPPQNCGARRVISDIQRPIEIVTKIGMNAAVKRAVNLIKPSFWGTKSVDAGGEESKRKGKDHEVR
jgi:hypothetical protein